MSEKQDKMLGDLITMILRVKDVYNLISKSAAASNKEELEKNVDYLKIVTELEDKLAKKAKLYELEESDQPLRRLYYLLRKKDLSEEEYFFVDQRLSFNVINEAYGIPFLSMEDNYDAMQEDNWNTITSQASKEMFSNILFYLGKEIESETGIRARKKLIAAYYNVIAQHKYLECYLLKAPQKLQTSGRERCIIFNQDKYIVDSAYFKFATENIACAINATLNLAEDKIKRSPKSKAAKKTNNAIIKSALELLTEEELEQEEYYIESLLYSNEYAIYPEEQRENTLDEFIELVENKKDRLTKSTEKTTQKKKIKNKQQTKVASKNSPN